MKVSPAQKSPSSEKVLCKFKKAMLVCGRSYEKGCEFIRQQGDVEEMYIIKLTDKKGNTRTDPFRFQFLIDSNGKHISVLAFCKEIEKVNNGDKNLKGYVMPLDSKDAQYAILASRIIKKAITGY